MEISKVCCGCGACYNICPKKAITMKLDEKGFVVPEIDENKCIKCNKCKNVCPTNNNKQEINLIDIKAVWSKDETVLEKSSSGGVFFELAKNIIIDGGYVYGAIYKNNCVEHVLTNNLEVLQQMQGSKYVQSRFENEYKEIEEVLNKNIKVLISGTTCQILGIKNYLIMRKANMENAIFVDLICHGAPSEKVFNDYLKELEENNNQKISSINFRDKRPGWNKVQMTIEGEKQTIVSEECIKNIYGKAFLKNLILRESCNVCQFKCIYGYSDITMGDFWGSHLSNQEIKNEKGVSVILIHSEKGKEAFNKISANFKVFNNIDIFDVINHNYPIINSSISHPCKQDFFNEYSKNNTNSISNLIDENMELEKMKYKGENSVGILNFHYEDHNYGANLVAYSLQQTLEKLGYNPYNINFNPYNEISTFEQYGIEAFRLFRQKYLKLTLPMNRDELNYSNILFDKFIVGSDQVWRKDITQGNLSTYFLDFVKDYKTKISYAASFGVNNWQGTEEETSKVREQLNKFDAISVREENAVEICKEKFNVNPEIVVDPTLLLSSEEYEKIIEEEDRENIDFEYAAYYFLFDNDGKIENSLEMKKLLDKAQLKMINIRGKEIELLGKKIFKYNTIGKWINYIKNSKIVVTDSYHGVIFSIIYNRPFVYVNNNKEAISRINNLKKFIDIEKQMYANIEAVDSLDIGNIDYEKANKQIAIEKTMAIDFLKKALKTVINPEKCKAILEKENVHLNKERMKNFENEKLIKNLEDKNSFNEKELQKNVVEMNKLYENIRVLIDKNDYLNKELEKNVVEMNKLYENIKILNSENKEVKQELKKSEDNKQEMYNQLNNILNSNSWKVTKPLRDIVRKIKNIK